MISYLLNVSFHKRQCFMPYTYMVKGLLSQKDTFMFAQESCKNALNSHFFYFKICCFIYIFFNNLHVDPNCFQKSNLRTLINTI